MHRLAVPLIVLVLTGCPQEGAEIDETLPDTLAPGVTAEDTLMAQPERASMWVGAGWVARTPNGRACVFVPKTAVEPGDSLRIEIERTSPSEKTLPTTLPPSFAQSGRKVFAPMYEFTVYDSADQEVKQFADSVTFAMCVHYRESEEGSFENAALAHPDSANPDSLELLPVVDPPTECQLMCDPRGVGSPVQQAWSPPPSWSGGLLTPVSAYAAAAEETYFKGIGGKGSGTSPFAAVDTLGAAGSEGAVGD